MGAGCFKFLTSFYDVEISEPKPAPPVTPLKDRITSTSFDKIKGLYDEYDDIKCIRFSFDKNNKPSVVEDKKVDTQI